MSEVEGEHQNFLSADKEIYTFDHNISMNNLAVVSINIFCRAREREANTVNETSGVRMERLQT